MSLGKRIVQLTIFYTIPYYLTIISRNWNNQIKEKNVKFVRRV